MQSIRTNLADLEVTVTSDPCDDEAHTWSVVLSGTVRWLGRQPTSAAALTVALDRAVWVALTHHTVRRPSPWRS